MTEHDPIDDAALETQDEFNALIQQCHNRDVVVRAVTGILATTAHAANSGAEARELVNAIVAEAREAIDDIYEVDRAFKPGLIDQIEHTQLLADTGPHGFVELP
jgi:hypothetical protein